MGSRSASLLSQPLFRYRFSLPPPKNKPYEQPSNQGLNPSSKYLSDGTFPIFSGSSCWSRRPLPSSAIWLNPDIPRPSRFSQITYIANSLLSTFDLRSSGQLNRLFPKWIRGRRILCARGCGEKAGLSGLFVPRRDFSFVEFCREMTKAKDWGYNVESHYKVL